MHETTMDELWVKTSANWKLERMWVLRGRPCSPFIEFLLYAPPVVGSQLGNGWILLSFHRM